jgi:general secretion pathway protein I
MRARNDAGFSLIETLVAFAIAALALTALVRVYSGAFAASGGAADRVLAAAIADEELERLIAAPPPPGTMIGPVREGRLIWEVRAEAVGQVPPAEAPLLVRLTLAVSRSPGGSPLVEVVTLRHVPAGDRVGERAGRR